MSCDDENNLLNNKSNGFDFNRRRFLSATIAAAGVTLASGVTLYAIGASDVLAESTNSVSNAVRWGMLVDASKCDIDCNANNTELFSRNFVKRISNTIQNCKETN